MKIKNIKKINDYVSDKELISKVGIIVIFSIFIKEGLMFALKHTTLYDLYINNTIYTYIIGVAFSMFYILLPFGLLFKTNKTQKINTTSNINKCNILKTIAAGLSIVFILNFINSVFIFFCKTAGLTFFAPFTQIPRPQNIIEGIILILCIAVIPAIIEELCFRYILVKSLLVSYGKLTAIMISSILFGLYHGNIPQTLFAFCSGILFSYLFISYQNIKIPIAIHLINNLINLALSIIPKTMHTLSILLNLTIYIITITGIIIIAKNISKFKIKKNFEKEKNNIAQIILSPLMLISVIYYLYKIYITQSFTTIFSVIISAIIYTVMVGYIIWQIKTLTNNTNRMKN